MSLDPTHIPDQPYNSDAVNRARNLLEAIPETVGPYRILERIGTGGMGEVYRAEQRTPIRREVALKLIKLGMDTKLVIARFEAERQALALMDHPHIAKVFDANADDAGRPYFVMEYVKGKPITEYADHQRLSIPERLELFEQVCQAVQHAHHKGVIHRDLKPSNVLVCTQDGKPFSKVIDFGVAKAIVQRLTEKTFFTEQGQFVGTPHYMSPEQAEGSIDIDTRTDVYSLGVLLYELLTGSTPFAGDELRKAAFDQLKRMVIEVDPPKPSTRLLASSASGRASALRVDATPPRADAQRLAAMPPNSPPNNVEPENPPRSVGAHSTPLETLARHRSTEPKRLSILVRGELDWIVMKALEKDRKRRYETPSSLATDIRSHLTGGTVLAAPPSLWYRTQKFARKYRYALIATGTAFALLLLTFLGTTYGLRRARVAEAVAQNSATQAVEARDEAMQERDAKEAQRRLAESAMLAEAKQRELAERQLIDGLLRPIGYGDEPTTAELRSFVDWSQIPDARLKLRILEVAFENPKVALRLARRAERAMQACIGLSPARRAKAIEIVSTNQRDMQADPRVRIAAAWLALELGSPDVPALPEALTWLSDPTAGGAEARPEFTELTDFITNRVETFSPDQITHSWDALIGVLEKSPDWDAWEATGDALGSLAPLLPSENVSRAWSDIIDLLESSQENMVHRAAGIGLRALATQITSVEMAHRADSVIRLLEVKDKPYVQQAACEALVILVPFLSSGQLDECWPALLATQKTSSEVWVVQTTTHAIVALTQKLDDEQLSRAAVDLIAILEVPTDTPTWRYAETCEVFAGIADRINTLLVVRGTEAMVKQLEASSDFHRHDLISAPLARLIECMSSDQVTRSFDSILGALENTNYDWAISPAGKSLIVFTGKLPDSHISKACDAMLGLVQNSTKDSAIEAAGQSLKTLGRRLVPIAATAASVRVADLLEAADGYRFHAACQSVIGLVPQLSPESATLLAETLTKILAKTPSQFVRRSAIEALAALSSSLSTPQQMHALDCLISILEAQEDLAYAGVEATALLLAMSPKLSDEQNLRGSNALRAVMQTSTDARTLEAAGHGLVALARTVNAEQIKRIEDELFGVLETTKDHRTLQAAGNFLLTLAPDLTPETRIRMAKLFVGTLHRVKDGDITEQLLALMPQLERPTQDQISTGVLTILLDYRALSENYFGRVPIMATRYEDLSAVSPGVMAMTNERSLASLLQHPAATGEPRENGCCNVSRNSSSTMATVCF